MPKAGKEQTVVVQPLTISQRTPNRWGARYGEMKSEEYKRLQD
jgi:hypothetical protein